MDMAKFDFYMILCDVHEISSFVPAVVIAAGAFFFRKKTGPRFVEHVQIEKSVFL